jgi:hypothetical protein
MQKKLLCGALALMALVGVPAVSHADIARGCKAGIMIGIPGDSFAHHVDTFEGRGGCKNNAQANKCRENAKNSIFRCGQDYWEQRGAAVLPASCRPGRGSLGVNGLGPFKPNKRNGSQYDLRFALEYTACCKAKPNADQLTFDVFVRSSGDKGCGKNKNELYYGDKSSRVYEVKVLHRGFKANCKKLRQMGWCD